MGFRLLARRRSRAAKCEITPDQTRSALRQAMGEGAEILFVHSSLSKLGYLTAGPEDVLAALRESSGTLALPTHTYSYPVVIDGIAPVFDANSTPSQNGLLTEVFRKQEGVMRSIQSTHSIAATGSQAHEITSGHYLADTPCGAGTPYARMIERKASALMWGVTFHSYTFFHTAEDAAGSIFAYEEATRDRLRVVDETGNVQVRTSKRQTRNARRFAECGHLLERVGLVRQVALGDGVLLFVRDCVKVHEFLVERLRRMPAFLFLNCGAPLA